jgi:hypothetical protein
MRSPKYAVIKHGGSRASSIHETAREAKLEMLNRFSNQTHEVQVREQGAIRCEKYCVFSSHCTQYEKEREKIMFNLALETIDP